MRYRLHPPLRALGMHRKSHARAVVPACVPPGCTAMRRVPGRRSTRSATPKVRHAERSLARDYRALVDQVLAQRHNVQLRAVSIAQLPDIVRGYEQIKLASIERFHAEANRLLA